MYLDTVKFLIHTYIHTHAKNDFLLQIFHVFRIPVELLKNAYMCRCLGGRFGPMVTCNGSQTFDGRTVDSQSSREGGRGDPLVLYL